MSQNPWNDVVSQQQSKPPKASKEEKTPSSTVIFYIGFAICCLLAIGEWFVSVYMRANEAESKANAARPVDACRDAILPVDGGFARCPDPQQRIEIVRTVLDKVSAYVCRCPPAPAMAVSPGPSGAAVPVVPEASP